MCNINGKSKHFWKSSTLTDQRTKIWAYKLTGGRMLEMLRHLEKLKQTIVTFIPMLAATLPATGVWVLQVRSQMESGRKADQLRVEEAWEEVWGRQQERCRHKLTLFHKRQEYNTRQEQQWGMQPAGIANKLELHLRYFSCKQIDSCFYLRNRGGKDSYKTDFKRMVAQQSGKGQKLKVVKWW